MTYELLDLPEPPTAIFAYSDTMAFGVLEAAQQRGLEIPSQLSVIGFDDVEIAQYFRLTTVRQPLHESGARGAELLLECMDSDDGVLPPVGPRHVVQPTELVVRSTTGPLLS
jgi:DNA-binding LacI/PurR family transcriptional regulator